MSDGLGADVAPDISDMDRKSSDQVLSDILQPNREINTNYIGYTVLTVSGQVFN